MVKDNVPLAYLMQWQPWDWKVNVLFIEEHVVLFLPHCGFCCTVSVCASFTLFWCIMILLGCCFPTLWVHTPCYTLQWYDSITTCLLLLLDQNLVSPKAHGIMCLVLSTYCMFLSPTSSRSQLRDIATWNEFMESVCSLSQPYEPGKSWKLRGFVLNGDNSHFAVLIPSPKASSHPPITSVGYKGPFAVMRCLVEHIVLRRFVLCWVTGRL